MGNNTRHDKTILRWVYLWWFELMIGKMWSKIHRITSLLDIHINHTSTCVHLYCLSIFEVKHSLTTITNSTPWFICNPNRVLCNNQSHIFISSNTHDIPTDSFESHQNLSFDISFMSVSYLEQNINHPALN